MSTPEQLEVAAPPQSRRERVPVWLDRSVRVLLLLFLLAGAVGSVLPHLASPASLEQLRADLGAGRVVAASAEVGPTVRWTADWWHWRSAQVPDGVIDRDAWLRDRVAESGQPVEVTWADSSLRGLVIEPPWLPLRIATLGAGLATFVIMLARRRRWLADRFGWFWLITGGLGAPAYLLLEPEPLWARPGRLPRLARWRRLPLSGLSGWLVGWVGVGGALVLVDLLRRLL